ncbi:glycine betaine ABC transporter substrate-binding protein [Klebsiella pneumoniae]|nr:glycine betaine ABC transporter substrate-binding protein [Klebsiella pneumoniae]
MRHSTMLATAAFATLLATSAFAADLPGKGITVKPAQSTISEESFQTLLVSRALEKLGYTVEKPSEVDYNVAYTSIAAGDTTFIATNWQPLHDDMYAAAGGYNKFYRKGVYVSGAAQGYLIDKKTAEQYHITSIDQLKDPQIAKLFDTNKMLIFFRVIQGIVAGPLIPLSQSLLLSNYPPAKRSIALALWSMTVIVAPICGPILGGYISDNYHWGWIFFINVPIGVAVVLMTLQTLRNRETKTEQRRIDGVGLALLIIGIGSLQVMLDRGKELDWFSSNEIIILTIVAVVAISFLIVWELTDDNPIVDLSLFKSRNFTIGCLCISLAYMLYFGAIVLLPQLLQEVYGYTATWAGLASAPVGVIPVILSPIIGRFAHKLDMRRLVTFSFIMYAVCFYWRAWTFEPGMDFGASAWPQFIQGFAVACFFMPLTTITLSGLPPERLAAASSLSNFTRTLAGSIGTSITTTLWTNREALHHAQLTESVTPFNPNAQQIYDQLQGMGMTQQQASGWIAQQITNQGLIISANEIFWISAAIFILLLGLVWFARPPFSAGGGGGGAH